MSNQSNRISCFYHKNTDATCKCTNCGKDICPNCLCKDSNDSSLCYNCYSKSKEEAFIVAHDDCKFEKLGLFKKVHISLKLALCLGTIHMFFLHIEYLFGFPSESVPYILAVISAIIYIISLIAIFAEYIGGKNALKFKDLFFPNYKKLYLDSGSSNLYRKEGIKIIVLFIFSIFFFEPLYRLTIVQLFKDGMKDDIAFPILYMLNISLLYYFECIYNQVKISCDNYQANIQEFFANIDNYKSTFTVSSYSESAIHYFEDMISFFEDNLE